MRWIGVLNVQEVSGFGIGHMLNVAGEDRRMGNVENGTKEKGPEWFLIALFLIGAVAAVFGISML